MITKCPHCSSLLDCSQDSGSTVDCAGCGKSFYALPCEEEAELERTREAEIIEARRQREAREAKLEKSRQQNELLKAKLKETRRQKEDAETLRQQRELSHQVDAIQGDALALAAIGRGSRWAGFMKILGIISIVIGVIAFFFLVGEESQLAFTVLPIFTAAGITCLFNAFLLDVFTDIRWLLSLLARPNHKND